MPLVAPLWIESEDLGYAGVGFKAFLRLRPKPCGFRFFCVCYGIRAEYFLRSFQGDI